MCFGYRCLQALPLGLTDCGWVVLAPVLPPSKPGRCPCSVDLHLMFSGIFYMLRSGRQWHLLPREFGP